MLRLTPIKRFQMFEKYNEQVKLVLECLPIVAKTKNYALKGGTAINMFLREQYPRLSVDIDLCYLPLQGREESLAGIQTGLLEICDNMQQALGYKIEKNRNSATKTITKLIVSNSKTDIKIEPNLILRGSVYPVTHMDLSKKVEDIYKLPVYNMPLIAKEEIYAGKICASLDRQHPRDLFDVKFILEEGISEKTKNAFLVYLISHNRPMHELLAPNRLNQSAAFVTDFQGMTDFNISYQDLVNIREQLIQTIKKILTEQDKRFLISVKKDAPQWEYLNLPNIENLPGVKWKLMNISKMEKQKANLYLEKLEQVLYD